MQYFIFDRDRKGTCYHEFYKGKWDGETHWKTDSLCLDDDILSENIGFAEAIMEVVPAYAPYGVTEISSKQWREIGRAVLKKDNRSIALYQEADQWLKTVFREYNCFTILGI